MMKRLMIVSLVVLLMASCSEKKINKSGKFDPEAIALNNRAVKMIREYKNDSALIILDKAIKADETYYMPHSNKVTVYVNKADYKNALKESLLAVEKKPDLAEGWSMAGMLSDKVGDTIKSKEYYQKSVELFDKLISDPQQKAKLVRNRLNRALSMILMGKEEEGRKEMIKLKEENPNDLAVDEFSKVDRKEFINKFFF